MKNTKKSPEPFRKNVLDGRGNQVYVGDLVRFSILGGEKDEPLVAYEVTWVGKGAISHGEDIQMKSLVLGDGLTVEAHKVVKLTPNEERRVREDQRARAARRRHEKILKLGRDA